MTPQERTMHAKLLKDNPLLQEIFDTMRDGLTNMAINANLANDKESLVIVQGFQIADKIRAYIENCINDEKIKEFNIKQKGKWF